MSYEYTNKKDDKYPQTRELVDLNDYSKRTYEYLTQNDNVLVAVKKINEYGVEYARTHNVYDSNKINIVSQHTIIMK